MVSNASPNVAPSHLSPLSGVTHRSPRSSPGARAFIVYDCALCLRLLERLEAGFLRFRF
jgi:hypothetical protein